MPDFLHSPSDLVLALLLASTLALGACLWIVWVEMRRLSRREQHALRETENYAHRQLAALNEKISGELARQRRDAEQLQHTLETSARRRLEELQALIESLRLLEAKFQARMAAPPAAPPVAAEPPPGTVAKEVRGGLSVIARPPKP